MRGQLQIGGLLICPTVRWTVLDPGVGFAKKGGQNCLLLRSLPQVLDDPVVGQYPMLVGPSRKKFIATAAGRVWVRLRNTADRLGLLCTGRLRCCPRGPAWALDVHATCKS
jgi:dihydropteroate synthase